MIFHAKKHEGLRDDDMCFQLKAKVFEYCRTAFKSVKWRIPDDFLSYEHFMRVVGRLDWNSSPGYPYFYTNTTNRSLFGLDKEGNINQVKLHSIWEIVQRRLEERTDDPIRLFVKPEPHKHKKICAKAYRLISSVSVIDQIIDHMLHDDLNDQIVVNWLNQPAKIGWSPYKGGWKIIPQNWIAMDKSAWDWSVRPWLLQAVLDLRISLCENMNEKWLELAYWRASVMCKNPVFITSGGCLFKQKFSGGIKSGSVETLASNSIAQVILHARVAFELGIEPPLMFTMGDDTIQQPIDNLEAYVSKLNEFCYVKEVIPRVEFAGHRFQGAYVEPLYRGKHAFVMLHMPDKIVDEASVSYSLLYHRSRLRDWVRDFFTQLGVELPDPSFFSIVYDGED